MGVAAPGDIFDGGGDGLFVDKDTKKRWAKDKVRLGIVRAEVEIDTQHGKKTRFHVVEAGQAVSEAKIFDMTTNDVRQRQARSINELLLEPGATVVAPVYLLQIPTDKGNPAWAFSKDPGDGTVAAHVPDEPVPAAASGDDSIPF